MRMLKWLCDWLVLRTYNQYIVVRETKCSCGAMAKHTSRLVRVR
jgi:hypothetical protein